MERVENPAGWDLQIVKSLAYGGVSDGHGRRLARQRAEPDQFVAPDFHRFTGLSVDRHGEVRQRDDLRWHRQEHLALTVPVWIQDFEFGCELGGVDGFGLIGSDTETWLERNGG